MRHLVFEAGKKKCLLLCKVCEAEVKHSAAEHAGAPSSRGRCLLTRQNITSVVASEKLEQQEKKKKKRKSKGEKIEKGKEKNRKKSQGTHKKNHHHFLSLYFAEG